MSRGLNPPPELVLLTDHLSDSLITAHHIRVWTRQDPILSSVLNFVKSGWPDSCEPALLKLTAQREQSSHII